MSVNPTISPSILAGDLTDMKSILKGMDPQVVDLLHIDVMDGVFVPQLSFGEKYTENVASHTAIPLDVHLMVIHPEREVPKYFALRPYNITFHREATHFPIRLAQEIRKAGIRAGIALNPATPVESLAPMLDEIDLILLMSVEPGFYGQGFIAGVMEKVAAVRMLIGERNIILQVDGGITTGNIRDVHRAGAQSFVAGSAAFKGADVNANVRVLKHAAVANN